MTADNRYLDILAGTVLIGAEDAVGMLRALVPELVKSGELTAEQAERVNAGLDAQEAEKRKLRADLDEARDAIANPVNGYIPRLAAATAQRDDMQAKWEILAERTMLARVALDDPADADPEVAEYLASVRFELLRKILDGEAGRDDLCAALVPKLAELERRRTQDVEARLADLTEQAERNRASVVRLAQSWARHGKGAIAAELLTEFEMDEDEVLGAEPGE